MQPRIFTTNAAMVDWIPTGAKYDPDTGEGDRHWRALARLPLFAISSVCKGDSWICAARCVLFCCVCLVSTGGGCGWRCALCSGASCMFAVGMALEDVARSCRECNCWKVDVPLMTAHAHDKREADLAAVAAHGRACLAAHRANLACVGEVA